MTLLLFWCVHCKNLKKAKELENNVGGLIQGEVMGSKQLFGSIDFFFSISTKGIGI